MLVYVRPSNEALPTLHAPLIKGVAKAALYCAHRASTFLLRALRARRAPGRSCPIIFRARVPEAQVIVQSPTIPSNAENLAEELIGMAGNESR